MTTLTPTLTDEQLARIELRYKASTGGEWEAQCEHDYHGYAYIGGAVSYHIESVPLNGDNKAQLDADVQFMAAAHQDIPALLAEVKRLKQPKNAPSQKRYEYQIVVVYPNSDELKALEFINTLGADGWQFVKVFAPYFEGEQWLMMREVLVA